MVKKLSIERRLQFNLLALNLKALVRKTRSCAQGKSHKLYRKRKTRQTMQLKDGKTKTTESKAPHISVSRGKKVQTEDNVARQ
jgi:hypothetical protein